MATQPGRLRIDNSRFLDDNGALFFATGGPLPAATAGTLKFEVQFRRGSVNQEGAYSSAPLRVAWALADGPWEELGLMPSAPFARVHPVTGNTVASLALPLRHAAENALPLLADGVSRLHLAVAPVGDALPSARGLALDDARTETVELWARAPDVSVEAPLYADSQLEGAATDYFLHVRQPARVERSFELEIAPPFRAEVPRGQLTLQPGDEVLRFQVLGNETGEFQIVVREAGRQAGR